MVMAGSHLGSEEEDLARRIIRLTKCGQDRVGMNAINPGGRYGRAECLLKDMGNEGKIQDSGRLAKSQSPCVQRLKLSCGDNLAFTFGKVRTQSGKWFAQAVVGMAAAPRGVHRYGIRRAIHARFHNI